MSLNLVSVYLIFKINNSYLGVCVCVGGRMSFESNDDDDDEIMIVAVYYELGKHLSHTI